MDPNYHLRNQLVRDAGKQCTQLGAKPDAILISGDIAFAGDADEYVFAEKWFEKLCKACGCDSSVIFVIPGNHDVQHEKAKKHLVQAVHKDIKNTEDHLLDTKLTGFLNDEDTAKQLYSSLANFNDFAVQYFCDLLPPDRTKAQRPFVLNDGSKLLVTGLNSAFVSSHTDKKGSLFVDPASFRLTNEDGVTHLVLCHHPYSWLANGQDLADHLNVVSKVQLFGHEHTNRIEVNRDWVRINASAAHPEKTEPGWEPGYNLIELSVETNNGHRQLMVDVHVRIWQSRPGQFVPKMDKEASSFLQAIPLEPWEAPEELAGETKVSGALPQVVPANDPDEPRTEEGTSRKSLRALSIRFFKLTFSQKLAISGRLSLLEEDDKKLPDHERFRQVLLRAKKRGLLDELENGIKLEK